MLYLNDYPFECSEQLASRVLGIAALRDVLTAFDAEGLPSPAELEAAVGADIARLQGLQNEDGGFPVWRRGSGVDTVLHHPRRPRAAARRPQGLRGAGR